MTYIEKWLNHNVWDGEDRSGCKNDIANFDPDGLLALLTDCQDDMQLELNRVESELERVNKLSATQARIILSLIEEVNNG